MCYGIAKILVTEEMSIQDLIKIIICFIIGFTVTVIGTIFIQKRTLEMLVQESDTRDLEKKENVGSLIFNKKVYNQGPKIVVIGGGAGLNTVLRGLKNYTDNITAIVTVSDYGEPTTSVMDDIKDSIIALSKDENQMTNLLNLNLQQGKENIKFSDLYFSAMQEIVGNFTKSIEESKNIFNITGKVLPVTLDAVQICAELEDGVVVESKEKIPYIVNERSSKISRIYVTPTNCRVAPGVIEAIQDADSIVIGPGSLYTNVIPNLLVPGVSKAIKESKAFKVYVSNIMTEVGQTDNYTLSSHIKAIIDHAGKGIIDYCIYDTGEVVPEYIRKYNEEGCDLVYQDVANVKGMGVKLMQRNLSTIENRAIRHNPDAIATAIVQIICDDLKFNDMQNNAQFYMLDTRIKETNKKLKSEKKLSNNPMKSKKLQKKNRKASKFYEKYKKRIETIRKSEKKSSEQIEEKKEPINTINRLDFVDRFKEVNSDEMIEKDKIRRQNEIKRKSNRGRRVNTNKDQNSKPRHAK